MSTDNPSNATVLEVRAADAQHAEDLGCYVVTVAAHPNGSSWHLIFSLADEFDEQDTDQGMDTYAISNHEGATVYGGIASVSRDDSKITLALDDQTAETLGLATQVELRFDGEAAAQRVAAGLERIVSAGP